MYKRQVFDGSDVGVTIGVDGFHLDSDGSLLLSLMLAATPVSYTHLRAHETVLDLVCRLLLEKKRQIYRLQMSPRPISLLVR